MKNLSILLFIAALFSFSSLSAQSFEKGDVMISPGFGIGTYGGILGRGFAVPVVLNFDVGVHEYVSVGAYGGFWTRKYRTFISDTRYTSAHVGVRASFHWWQLLDEKVSADLLGDKLDVYLTAWGGYNVRSSLSRGQGGLQMGVRYFFTEAVGVFGEFGGTPTSYTNVGFTFKF